MSAIFDLLDRVVRRWSGNKTTYNPKFIMADDREEENTRINVVVKTSKSKETIETEPTATILEVLFYFINEKFAWSSLK